MTDDPYTRLRDMLHLRCTRPIADQLLDGIRTWAEGIPSADEAALRRDLADAQATVARVRAPDAHALVSLLVWLDLDTDIAYLVKPKEPLWSRTAR